MAAFVAIGKRGWILAVVAAAAALALVLAYARDPGPPRAPAARAWLAAGTHEIETFELVFRDASRPTPGRDGRPLAPHRDLPTSVWAPRDGSAHPLLVLSHGFSGTRNEEAYLALAMARLGYVVVAPEFPRTHGGAPGGPDIADVVNQPGDVRFLIDRMLGANADPRHRLRGRIDPARIGAAGVSLGGLTTTLVGFDAERFDPRVRAIASLAGPTFLFDRTFFAARSVPMLLVAGTADGVVEYAANVPPLLERLPGSLVVSIRNGSHTGFAQRGSWLRWFDHPDRILCWLLGRRLEGSGALPLERLGGSRHGILVPDRARICEHEVTTPAMNPIRQRWLVELAVTRFFEAQFHADPVVRAESWSYLTDGITREIPEVTARSSPRRELADRPPVP